MNIRLSQLALFVLLTIMASLSSGVAIMGDENGASWIKKPLDLYQINEMDNLLIECEFKLAQQDDKTKTTTMIVWRKNGLILAVNRILSDESRNYRILPSQNQMSSTLFIQNVSAIDNGVYTCSLTNDYGSVLQTTNSTIRVNVLPKYLNMKLSESNRRLSEIETEVNDLHGVQCCFNSNVNPVPKQYELYINGELKTQNGHLLNGTSDDDGSSSSLCFLFDFKFKLNYLYNRHMFKCVLRENQTAASVLIHSEQQVNLFYSPKLNLTSSVNVSGKRIDLNENESLILTCNVNANPMIGNETVKWFLNNQTIDGNHGEMLIIGRIQKEQSGLYRCWAQNAYGREYSNEVLVNVLYVHLKPKYSINNSNRNPSEDMVEASGSNSADVHITVLEGSNLSLACELETNIEEFKGDKQQQIKWYFNSNQIEQNQTNLAIELNNIDAKLNQNSIYKCQFNHNLVYLNYILNIQYSPKIAIDVVAAVAVSHYDYEQVDNVFRSLNDTASFKCGVDAMPLSGLQVKWTFNENETLKQNSVVASNERELSLEIERIEMSHFGRYTCEARNSIGVQKRTVHLQQNREPDMPQNVSRLSDGNGVKWVNGLNGGDGSAFNVLNVNDGRVREIKLFSLFRQNEGEKLIRFKNIDGKGNEKRLKLKVKTENKYGSSNYTSELMLEPKYDEGNNVVMDDDDDDDDGGSDLTVLLNGFYKFNSKYICIYTKILATNGRGADEKFYYKLNVYSTTGPSINYEMNLINFIHNQNSHDGNGNDSGEDEGYYNQCFSFIDFKNFYLQSPPSTSYYTIDLSTVDLSQQQQPLSQEVDLNSDENFKNFKRFYSMNVTLCSYRSSRCLSRSFRIKDDYLFFNENVSMLMVIICSIISILLILLSVLFCYCHYYLSRKQRLLKKQKQQQGLEDEENLKSPVYHPVYYSTDRQMSSTATTTIESEVTSSTSTATTATTTATTMADNGIYGADGMFIKPITVKTTTIKYSQSPSFYTKSNANSQPSPPESGYSTPKKLFYEVIV